MTEDKLTKGAACHTSIITAKAHLETFDKYVAAGIGELQIRIKAHGDNYTMSHKDCFPLNEKDIIEIYRLKLVQKIEYLTKEFESL